MTKEQLRNTIAMMVGESPSEPGSLTIELLALFDRYEEEQWKPATEPPNDDRDVLGFYDGCETEEDSNYYENVWWMRTRWSGVISHWRELPTPPKKYPNDVPPWWGDEQGGTK